MKLYEINEAILGCIDQETGEVIDPEKLDALTMERETKLENVALWIKDLKAEASRTSTRCGGSRCSPSSSGQQA